MRKILVSVAVATATLAPSSRKVAPSASGLREGTALMDMEVFMAFPPLDGGDCSTRRLNACFSVQTGTD